MDMNCLFHVHGGPKKRLTMSQPFRDDPIPTELYDKFYNDQFNWSYLKIRVAYLTDEYVYEY